MKELKFDHYVPISWCSRFALLRIFSEYYVARPYVYQIIFKTGTEEYKEMILRRHMPNNWLKMHGYRMRRRKRVR